MPGSPAATRGTRAGLRKRGHTGGRDDQTEDQSTHQVPPKKPTGARNTRKTVVAAAAYLPRGASGKSRVSAPKPVRQNRLQQDRASAEAYSSCPLLLSSSSKVGQWCFGYRPRMSLRTSAYDPRQNPARSRVT